MQGCHTKLSFGQVYAAVRLLVSSNGSADVSSILLEDVSITSKLAATDPMKAGKSFTAKLTGLGRKTGTSTPDVSFAPRPSISQRCDDAVWMCDAAEYDAAEHAS